MGATVLLVDDHTIVREGIRALLTARTDLEVVGEAADGHEGLRRCRELHPALVVMDVSMPAMNGVDATEAILAELPATRVLALSMHANAEFVQGILRAGAAGYLLKSCVADEIVAAVRTVLQGGFYVCSQLTDTVLSDYVGRLRHREQQERKLSLRERQVLQLLAEGQSSKQIADRLCISPRTVEMHRGQLCKKLGVSSVAELPRYAILPGVSALE